MRGAALLALAVLVLPACADEAGGGAAGPGTDPDALLGVTWRLDAASVAALVDDAPQDAVVTLAFEDGQVSGTAACNSFFGAYEATEDGSIAISGLGQTEMACDPPSLMTLESAYLGALAVATTFDVNGGLELTGGDVALRFDEEVPPEPLPLVGTVWTLDSVYQGDAVSSLVVGTDVTMTLGQDGVASGSGGCNAYHGDYTRDDDALAFGPIASTKMACADDVMGQEAVFFAALEDVASSSIEGSRLTLLDVSGAPLLGFVGAPAST